MRHAELIADLQIVRSELNSHQRMAYVGYLDAAIAALQAEPVPMTDAEIGLAWLQVNDPIALGSKFENSDAVREFTRAIEAHHGIKPKGE